MWQLMRCNDIIGLKIPGLLLQLSYLKVFDCRILQVIQSKAPNLSTFHFYGTLVQLSIGDSLQMKNLELSCLDQYNIIYYARAKLPSIVPNLETLSICSASEVYSETLDWIIRYQCYAHSSSHAFEYN